MRLTPDRGAGHYSSTFSAAELFAALYYAHLRIDPARPELAGPRPLHPEQGPRRHRPLSGARRSRLLRAALLDNYTRLGSPFGDHPDMKKITGHRLQLRLARARPLDRASAWRLPAACRSATTASTACSATASCTRVRSGKRRWPPATSSCRAWSASSTATGLCIDGHDRGDHGASSRSTSASAASAGTSGASTATISIAILGALDDLEAGGRRRAADDHRRHDQGPRRAAMELAASTGMSAISSAATTTRWSPSCSEAGSEAAASD